AVFLQAKRDELLNLINRAEQLSVVVDSLTDLVVCHADLHAGNLLLDDSGKLFVVDWDTLLLAPKERDLLFVGGGLLGNWCSAAEEVALFYAGYGETAVNRAALAYFRYDRLLEDIALYGEELLLTNADSADRAQALYYLQANFRPNGTIALAQQAEGGE
ncbi:MAG: phosphotransferase, partial [Anaerolineales bacterium]|nr:phosphotransferase [Anaerolineales bacterium]